MTEVNYAVVYQCKKCNTILGDSSSSVGESTSLTLDRLSTDVFVRSSQVYCSGCQEIVATKENDCMYELEPSQIHIFRIGNFNQKIKRLEDQIKEQDKKLSQLNSRIIELGVQAIANRLDLITHKYAIEHNNPGFSITQFKAELDSLNDPV